MNFKKVLTASLSLLFAAPLSSMAMKENVDNIEEEKGNNEEIENPCPICYSQDMDKIEDKDAAVCLCCHKKFCKECLVAWLHGHEACPMCRNKKEGFDYADPEDNSTTTVNIKKLPQMANKSDKEIVDELMNMLQEYKGLAVCYRNGIYTSNFCVISNCCQENGDAKANGGFFLGKPLVVDHDGQQKEVKVYNNYLRKLLEHRFTTFNGNKLDEERERWGQMTDKEVKAEKNKLKNYKEEVMSFQYAASPRDKEWCNSFESIYSGMIDQEKDYAFRARRDRIFNGVCTTVKWGTRIGATCALVGLGYYLLSHV